MGIIEDTYSITSDFIDVMPKKERKLYGQFFTPSVTAAYMSSLFSFRMDLPSVSILDPGAGSGILSAAAVFRLRECGFRGRIHLTCYETDGSVRPLLEKTLERLREECNIEYLIKTDNYITSQTFGISESEGLYDLVISNPPYKKIPKDSPEAKVIPEVCFGSPNLYFLFLSMSIHNMKDNGQAVYIIPRSWTSGAYFASFRKFLHEKCAITDIHLFGSRNKVFDGESVLQETMIMKVVKTSSSPDTVSVTFSDTASFDNITEFKADYSTVVNPEGYVFLVTSPEECNTLSSLMKFKHTLASEKIKMKTGIVVGFRTQEVLRNAPEEKTYPLIYSQHIQNGKVIWPCGKENEYILTDKSGLLQPNGNYLIVKRFTAKEETRRLQCGVFLKEDYSEYEYFSTDNKVNYIFCDRQETAFGLYVLFNSTLYDRYYRILNGSTQVNSTEINSMPVPSRNVIDTLGRELEGREPSVHTCDQILEKWIKKLA